jgi:hypothetical protein
VQILAPTPQTLLLYTLLGPVSFQAELFRQSNSSPPSGPARHVAWRTKLKSNLYPVAQLTVTMFASSGIKFQYIACPESIVKLGKSRRIGKSPMMGRGGTGSGDHCRGPAADGVRARQPCRPPATGLDMIQKFPWEQLKLRINGKVP